MAYSYSSRNRKHSDNIVEMDKPSESAKPSHQDQNDADDDKHCPVCLEEFSDATPAVNLDKCKHKFCQPCLDEAMNHKPVCPICGQIYGMIKGNQPDGTMDVIHSKFPSLPGYEGCGIITINYSFPSGIQGPSHPNPGKRYNGTTRTAYLPNNEEGKKIVGLLRQAFDARVTFTIGESLTTGARNNVTWNDIHHKTNTGGGPQHFGYPDPTYLQRLKEELAAKGIK